MISALAGKKILIGVSAGIAAYKVPHLVRLLIKKQASVRVVMTPNAKQFVSPLVLSVLSGNEVSELLFTSDNQWNSHVELGLWADAFLIAPATANTLSGMATGRCDNLLLATYLSAKCPVFFAPAMDLDMHKHPSTQKNINQLKDYGNLLIPSEFGELASGLVGQGRMAEPEEMVRILENYFFPYKGKLSGKKILITAGPTYQSLDPVRFIGNHSSGKMGIALANVAAQMGAEVTLVLGPAQPNFIEPSVQVQKVQSAEQMYNAVHQYFKECDIAILSAAVADYTPEKIQEQKIKKKEDNFSLQLIKTKDILASLGKEKKNQVVVGFALETQNELENAKNKIVTKNIDAIVLNSLNDKGAGFGTETNKVTFITKNMQSFPMELKSKQEVAIDILNAIIKYCI